MSSFLCLLFFNRFVFVLVKKTRHRVVLQKTLLCHVVSLKNTHMHPYSKLHNLHNLQFLILNRFPKFDDSNFINLLFINLLCPFLINLHFNFSFSQMTIHISWFIFFIYKKLYSQDLLIFFFIFSKLHTTFKM